VDGVCPSGMRSVSSGLRTVPSSCGWIAPADSGLRSLPLCVRGHRCDGDCEALRDAVQARDRVPIRAPTPKRMMINGQIKSHRYVNRSAPAVKVNISPPINEARVAWVNLSPLRR
jgi:hypothetical protein